ncbi:V-type ATP synthase subunit E [Hydrogenoanaerobacterium sp.]|uniref:V-type ATP synthase subunit E n=1 Tax=Hydrogenoanaerobacterium sp. TaxID=2953763 RepID=UPI0028972C2C|nr:V-type ATP synthase subunit E [Hydrogenoanaerobacterium sp.]
MTGLDKILSQIQHEADEAAAAVLAKAKSEAENIVSAGAAKGKADCESIAQQSEHAVADVLARATSAAALQKRKTILTAKQQLINDTIVKARQSLYELPQEQYFSIILKMAQKFALPQEGEILFSAADLQRLPEGFEATLNNAVKAKGATLKVSGETRNIDGGFVLTYGGVEENCSFEALFSSAHDTLQDKVHQLLFS